MRIRQIEVFHAVYVTGSVSGAARALNVSQPTVSKVLRQAEDQLGFDLFDRVSGRLMPSEKGKRLFVEIQPVFEKLNELNKFTTMLKNTKAGRLKFAMTPAFGLEVGPIALAAFSRTHPDVTIETETLHSHEIVKALMDHTIDIGVMFDAPSSPGVETLRIGQTGFVCVAPEGMTLPKGSPLSLRDIQDYPLITLSQKSVLGQILNRKLEDIFDGPADSHIVAETYHLAKRLVKQNAGIAVIDGITALSGDMSGLQIRKTAPSLNVNIEVITRLNDVGVKFRSAFIAELQAAVDKFTGRKRYKRLIN